MFNMTEEQIIARFKELNKHVEKEIKAIKNGILNNKRTYKEAIEEIQDNLESEFNLDEYLLSLVYKKMVSQVIK